VIFGLQTTIVYIHAPFNMKKQQYICYLQI
jgi:hypothetical protein